MKYARLTLLYTKGAKISLGLHVLQAASEYPNL